MSLRAASSLSSANKPKESEKPKLEGGGKLGASITSMSSAGSVRSGNPNAKLGDGSLVITSTGGEVGGTPGRSSVATPNSQPKPSDVPTGSKPVAATAAVASTPKVDSSAKTTGSSVVGKLNSTATAASAKPTTGSATTASKPVAGATSSTTATGTNKAATSTATTAAPTTTAASNKPTTSASGASMQYVGHITPAGCYPDYLPPVTDTTAPRYDVVSPKKSMSEWKRVALQRLGYSEMEQQAMLEHGTASHAVLQMGTVAEVQDEMLQTELVPRTRDAETITAVAAADLRRLIPIPDGSTLMKSTVSSLRAAESQAVALLAVIQRDLHKQLQEAGLGYSAANGGGGPAGGRGAKLRFSGAVLGNAAIPQQRRNGGAMDNEDVVLESGAIADPDLLTIQGGMPIAREMLHQQQLQRYWQGNRIEEPGTFVRKQHQMELYSASTKTDTAWMEMLRRGSIQRHRVFDEVDADVEEQQKIVAQYASNSLAMKALAAQQQQQQQQKAQALAAKKAQQQQLLRDGVITSAEMEDSQHSLPSFEASRHDGNIGLISLPPGTPPAGFDARGGSSMGAARQGLNSTPFGGVNSGTPSEFGNASRYDDPTMSFAGVRPRAATTTAGAPW